jgi:hypothetical protein
MVYNVSMIKTYTLEDPKPNFKDGDMVIVDMSVMGSTGLLAGTVVGRGMENIIDFWYVQFKKNFAPTYPFKVIPVIHTAIVRSMPAGEMADVLERNQ